mgnify:CR=1 FL=1
MQKDLREEVLKRVQEEKEKYQNLQRKLARLQELQENSLIKEYFSLHQEVGTYLEDNAFLEEFPILQQVDYAKVSELIAKEPLKKVFSRPLMLNCKCDILIEYGKSGLFRQPTILRYVCLNCGRNISLTKKEQQKFEKGRTIIPINYSDVRAIDFYQIRERYIDLLQDLSCEEAIQVLKEELKFQERTLTRN